MFSEITQAKQQGAYASVLPVKINLKKVSSCNVCVVSSLQRSSVNLNSYDSNEHSNRFKVNQNATIQERSIFTVLTFGFNTVVNLQKRRNMEHSKHGKSGYF